MVKEKSRFRQNFANSAMKETYPEANFYSLWSILFHKETFPKEVLVYFGQGQSPPAASPYYKYN